MHIIFGVSAKKNKMLITTNNYCSYMIFYYLIKKGIKKYRFLGYKTVKI